MLFLDYYYLWAAATVLLGNGNPYDADMLAQSMYAAGYPADKFAPMFPYPPWALTILLPLGMLPFPISIAIWTLVSLVLCFAGIRGLLKVLPEITLDKQIVVFAVVSFLPLWKLVLFGQSSFLVFSGSVIVAYALANRRPVMAAAGVTLMAVKPHLLLIALTYILTSQKKPKGARLIGVILAGLGLLCLPLFFFQVPVPTLFGGFWNVASTHSARVPLDCSLASLVSLVVGRRMAVTFLLTFSGLIWAAHRGFYRGWNTHDFFLTVLPIGVATAPFAWSHDYVLLLPVLFAAVQSVAHALSERQVIAVLFVVNALMAVALASQREYLIGILPVLLLSLNLTCSAPGISAPGIHES